MGTTQTGVVQKKCIMKQATQGHYPALKGTNGMTSSRRFLLCCHLESHINTLRKMLCDPSLWTQLNNLARGAETHVKHRIKHKGGEKWGWVGCLLWEGSERHPGSGLCLASRGLCLLQRRGGRQLVAPKRGGNAVLALYFRCAAAPICAVAARLTRYKPPSTCSSLRAVMVRL